MCFLSARQLEKPSCFATRNWASASLASGFDSRNSERCLLTVSAAIPDLGCREAAKQTRKSVRASRGPSAALAAHNSILAPVRASGKGRTRYIPKVMPMDVRNKRAAGAVFGGGDASLV